MSFSGEPGQSLVFDLTDDDQGGFYRVTMANQSGELNRRAMINRGDQFLVVAELVDAVHGKAPTTVTNPDGTVKTVDEDATLLIANFYFLPSRDKRFVGAIITWTFTSDDPAVEIAVDEIAPRGTWSFAPVQQAREVTATGKASAGPKGGPASVNLSGEYGLKKTTELDFHTKVSGAPRMMNRAHGGYDGVRWTLVENDASRSGICRMLQVGVLLRRTVVAGKTPARPGSPAPAPTFRGELDVVADKSGWSKVASRAKRVWKSAERDEAVVFQPGTDRRSGNFDIDSKNLKAVDLQHDVMFMSLHESFEEVRKERDERAAKKREEKEKGKNAEKENIEKKEAKGGTGGSGLQVQVPSWVFFVLAGVAGLWLWQQLVAVRFT
ncbi:uncharacterized protein C8A04DRAFT_13904 [Dichotomopilus funicola]|uniref:Uncharacterized protein n=1 Tax=Dichotomopilus funicola TaxID=1934379 RepID=A0AAN6UZJ5_9PEZI|nr:hypothetical protein C8A04DRAFT_13904 [Dichotomopilus funicola]